VCAKHRGTTQYTGNKKAYRKKDTSSRAQPIFRQAPRFGKACGKKGKNFCQPLCQLPLLVISAADAWSSHFRSRKIEKFIIRQPPIGEKDDYDSENSWISDGLPSSSRRRRRGGGRWEV